MLRDVVPHRAVGVDPPGVGPVSNGVPDRKTLATVWTGVLRWAAGEAQPVVVVGHSWGALLARLAFRHRDLAVAAAILLDAARCPGRRRACPWRTRLKRAFASWRRNTVRTEMARSNAIWSRWADGSLSLLPPPDPRDSPRSWPIARAGIGLP
ncbi:MAG: alpha/beta fold hydrolase [Clostridia bacterium]